MSQKLVTNGWPLRQIDLQAQLAGGAICPGRRSRDLADAQAEAS